MWPMSAGRLRSHADTGTTTRSRISAPQRTGAAAGAGNHHTEGSLREQDQYQQAPPSSQVAARAAARRSTRRRHHALQAARRPFPPARCRPPRPRRGAWPERSPQRGSSCLAPPAPHQPGRPQRWLTCCLASAGASCGSPNCLMSLSRPRRPAGSARCARPAWPARSNALSHVECGAARSSTREPSLPARGRADGRPGPGSTSAKATAAAQRPREEIMHPFILQQLAAEHVKDQLAAADDTRRARQARRARRSRASRRRTRLSLPGTQAGLQRRSATIAARPGRRRRRPLG